MTPASILILLAHPDLSSSRATRCLVEQAQELPNVTVHDLYALYPGFAIDVKQEQALLVAADLIVFQHPLYWYSSPALLKEWQDRVLEYGFAFGSSGTALHGKDFFSAITTGGSREAYEAGGYNNYTISEFLRPFQQTANLCGMRHQAPFVVHSALTVDMPGSPCTTDEELAEHARRYRDRLASYEHAVPTS